jgi:signal transduction histidine kinase
MNYFKGLINSIKEIPAKYPAVISAYIIYMYLFFVMIRFFIVAKKQGVDFYDVIEVFDALPFMWLLAMTLVKVIHIRTRLHESETQRLIKEKELEVKETQMGTMREVVLGMQHHINNPMAIILLTIHKIKRTITISPELGEHIASIESESKRITQVLKDFSQTEDYGVEQIGTTTSAMAVPGKHL